MMSFNFNTCKNSSWWVLHMWTQTKLQHRVILGNGAFQEPDLFCTSPPGELTQQTVSSSIKFLFSSAVASLGGNNDLSTLDFQKLGMKPF